jgi:trk system potassium uptake protein TrkH
MRPAIVAKVLSLVTTVVSLFLLWGMAWAVWDGSSDLLDLGASLAAGLAVSGLLFCLGRNAKASELGPREAFAVVSLSWILCSGIGALPFYLHGSVPTYTDAFFEAMSGFTTTGASVLTNIEVNPRGILFWRSLTHWLGGMGIIVLSLAILPFLGVGGMQLFKAEVPGPVPEKLTPRIQKTALLLWGVYVILSVAETILLMTAGMNLFDALTHTFGTMATGGFSPKNVSVGFYGSAAVDWIITIFMFLAGANFTLHYFALRGRLSVFWKDEEFRFYSWVTLLGTATVMAVLLAGKSYASIGEALRYSAFQVVSILTTTGFVTADFEKWPTYTQLLLLVLMFVGGCAGSTGGGIKNVRILLLGKQMKNEIQRLLHPKAILVPRVGGRIVEREAMNSVAVFFIVYMGLFVGASLVMAGMGLDLVSAISSVAATLGNIGPGLGIVGPMDNYSAIPQAGKWVLSFCMLLGRLELFTVLMLFIPGTWRK